MNRFAVGSCEAVNPWNRIPYSVSLAQGDVHSFDFWTRHLATFAKFLPQIAERAPFYVRYTVIGYPRSLVRSFVATERAVTGGFVRSAGSPEASRDTAAVLAEIAAQNGISLTV